MNPHTLHTLKKGATRCPRFNTCNAPICPLDDWQRAQHLQGEPVCGLLSELVKDGGEARLRASLPSALVDTLASALPKITVRWHAIRSRLARASRQGSKLVSGQRLKQAQNGVCADTITQPATVLPAKQCALGRNALDGGSGTIGANNGSR
ncbi:MAG: hypothetical protein ABIU96_04925 [Rhodanobacter sp.]